METVKMNPSNEVKFSYLLGNCHKVRPTNVGAEKAALARPDTLVTMTMPLLVKYLTAGYTISPAVLKGGMSASNWVNQQLFMTDHDKGLTVEQALERCKEHSIKPSFGYYTFGSTPEAPRFRLCFLLDEPITTEQDRASVVDYFLSTVFPEADQSCRDACRIFFGAGAMGVIECFQQAIS
jgi:hypothetical protein